MATAFERTETRGTVIYDGDKPEWELEYCVLDAVDEPAAYTAVAAIAPTQLQGLTRIAYREPFKFEYKGGNVWHVKAPYKVQEKSSGSSQDPQGTTFTLEFDTSGETTKRGGVKSDKQLKYSWSDGVDPAPDIKGMLGWDGKKANGVDIVAPGLKLTLKVEYAASAVSSNVIKEWSRKTGKVNGDSFLGFAPGELLNLGAKGTVTLDIYSMNATGNVPVAFSFLASENIYGWYWEGEIAINGKGGHQYVDVVSGKWDDTTVTPTQTVEKLLYAYVSTVYDSTSFRALTGIR